MAAETCKKLFVMAYYSMANNVLKTITFYFSMCCIISRINIIIIIII